MKKFYLLIILLLFPLVVHAEVYKELVTLTELNEIKDNKEALNAVFTVTVSKTDNINNLYLIKNCPNISNITIEKQDINDIEILNNFTSSTDLTMSFSNVYIDLKGLHNDYITELYFSSSHIKNFDEIINLHNLEYLSLDVTEGYQNIAFSKMPKLNSISLSAQFISDYEVLINELTNITSLDLKGSNLKNEDAKYITKLKNLEQLNITGTYIDNITFLKELPNLKGVVLPLGLETQDLDVLYELPNLKSVNWDGYTELQVTTDLLEYLDRNKIYYPKYYPEILNQVDNIIEELNINNESSTEDKIYSVSRYIAQNMSYDTKFNDKYYTSLDLFVLGKYGVCHDYSLLTYTLLKKLGVEDVHYVSGAAYSYTNTKYSTGGHAWNSVKIDNVWYGIDNTWVSTANNLDRSINLYVLQNIDKNSSNYAKIFDAEHVSYSQPKYALEKINPEIQEKNDENKKENSGINEINPDLDIQKKIFKGLIIIALISILCIILIKRKQKNNI